MQSALNPYAAHADAVTSLSWILFAGGVAVFAIVAAVAAWALLAPPAKRRALAGHRAVIVGGILFPAVVVSALFFYSLGLARALYPEGEPDVRIEVIGHQWWWHVRYLNGAGDVDFVTANELRLPAGRTVELALTSADVIHSFWVPALAGKLDMIPGHVNRLRLSGLRETWARGQCAEYCGGPHALMSLYVAVVPESDFEQWRTAQRAPARGPADQARSRGQELFLAHCAACHAVRGTAARGALGPDLTHVGSRRSLAAGVLPNNPESVARWIRDAQRIKPGNLMPSLDIFAEADLRALAAYVAALE